MIHPSQISYSSSASQTPKMMVPSMPTATSGSPTRATLNRRTTSLGTVCLHPGDDDDQQSTKAAIHESADKTQRQQPVVELHQRSNLQNLAEGRSLLLCERRACQSGLQVTVSL